MEFVLVKKPETFTFCCARDFLLGCEIGDLPSGISAEVRDDCCLDGRRPVGQPINQLKVFK
ncbi:hypothetical protein [Ruegeria sp. MALMAid1280]|uniref:hypothetical protein n=1 Tax=Ruegeria sp. MALMAid1280 TaxID=3411634 RepID=UPI003BA34D7B